MTTCVDLSGERRQIRAQSLHLSLRQVYVDRIGEAAIEAPLSKISVAARGINILAEHDQLSLLRTQTEIGPGDIGCNRHQRPVTGVLEGLGVGGSRFDLPPELA